MKKVKVAATTIAGLSVIAGAGGYIEQSNDVKITDTEIVFDSQEEYETTKNNLTNKYIKGEINRMDDAIDLGKILKYEKGNDFKKVKQYLKKKEQLNLVDRIIFIDTLNAEREQREEEIILLDNINDTIFNSLLNYLTP